MFRIVITLIILFGLVCTGCVSNSSNPVVEDVIEVEDTSHCHFEFPVDGKCSFVCGKGENRFSREMIQQTIVGLTTAFLLWQTGIDTHGETWWTDSQLNYTTLRKAGYIKKSTNDRTELNQ